MKKGGMSFKHLLYGMGVVLILCFSTQLYAADEDNGKVPFVQWNLSSLDKPCHGDCSAMLFVGRFVDTGMKDIFFKPVPIWDWKWRDSYFLGAAFSRRLVTLGDMLEFDAEAGAGKRFGGLHEGELWLALYMRWTKFPWNNIIKTTIGVSTGIDYATGISPVEVARGQVGYGRRLLHYFSPELTFQLPNKKNFELVLRLHHRSGAYGIISNIAGGAQYASVGLRYFF